MRFLSSAHPTRASWECAFYGAPLIEQDIEALSGAGVRLCCRPAAIAAGIVSHCWIRTGEFNMGLGGNPDVIPGEAYESLYIAGTYVIDHSRDYPFNGCEIQPNVSESCVNDILSREIGTYQGRFSFIAIDGFNNGSFTFGVGDKTLKKQYNITITHLPEA